MRKRSGPKPTPIDGSALVGQAVNAVMAGKSPGRALRRELSGSARAALTAKLGMDVDIWREQFCAKLRRTSDRLLDRLERSVDKLPIQSLAYNLAVVVDKHSAIDAKAVASGSVLVQVNNYGSTQSKDDLIAQLKGVKRITQETPPIETESQLDPKPRANQSTPNDDTPNDDTPASAEQSTSS